MKYYAVAEIEITDRSWVAAYIQNVTRLVEQRGGRYLARTSKIEKLEGEPKVPQVFLIIEWPSREAAKAFYESEEYRRIGRVAWQERRINFCLWPARI
jgi:uncharacterized protein (DUF1330 family)